MGRRAIKRVAASTGAAPVATRNQNERSSSGKSSFTVVSGHEKDHRRSTDNAVTPTFNATENNSKNEDGTSQLVKFVTGNILVTILALGLFVYAEISNHGMYSNIALAFGSVLGLWAVVSTYHHGGERSFGEDWKFWQPLKGGVRFVVFQGFGWAFFTLSLLLPMMPAILAVFYPKGTIQGLVIAAGATCVVSEIFMVCSLLTYNRPGSSTKEHRKDWDATGIKDFFKTQTSTKWWSSFIGLQFLLGLIGLGCTLLIDTYAHSSAHAGMLFLTCATVCLAISVFVTYGIGGRWKHHGSEWKFFQPFSGGIPFVTLQAVSWTFFSISCVVFVLHALRFACQLEVVCANFGGLERFITSITSSEGGAIPSPIRASSLGIIAQVLNVVSLFVFRPKEGEQPQQLEVQQQRAQQPQQHKPQKQQQQQQQQQQQEKGANESQQQGSYSIIERLTQLIVVLIFYNTEKIMGIGLVTSWYLAAFYPRTMIGTWVGVGALYLTTFRGEPSRTGWRMIPNLEGNWFYQQLAGWFSLRIIQHDSSDFNGTNKYIFGYHPHGILPITCGYFHKTKQWMDLFKSIQPSSLTASIIHYVPVLRDAAQLSGGFEVSRAGFKAAIKLRKSAYLVPGGQREMAYSRSEDTTVTLSVVHKGFIRLAFDIARENREPLFIVPSYSFGETQVFDNIRLPEAVQRFCIDTLRANVIFFPYGLLGLPGCPRPVGVTVVVGKAIEIPKLAYKPSPEQISLFHRKYYTELHKAFYARRVEADHDNDELKFDPPLHLLDDHMSDEQFRAAWEDARPDDKSPVVAQHRKASPFISIEAAWISLALLLMFIGVVYRGTTSDQW